MINENPHRRYNILTGEWVLVSPHRTKRPWQGKEEKQSIVQRPSYDPNCYLCPGNTRASGASNPQYEGPYSFVNDFSALLSETPKEVFSEGLLKGVSERGVCKVVCFSPDHSLTLPIMKVEEIQNVVKLWKREYEELSEVSYINHIQIFENKGDVMGCSNPHPHGQIWAQESIPLEVSKKTAQMKKYWLDTNQSLLQAYLKQELETRERIILENDHFVSLVPYWAIWPYETMILPKEQKRSIKELNEKEIASFAQIIKDLTIRYDNLFNCSFPYSAGIHQAPTDGDPHEEWHFHMSFYPPLLRSATVKKFMVGYEMFADPQRDITAEQAAETLKSLSTVHYTTG
ncbi:UDP-glucose--hexose-1-phosphate uridylyltransferase [uncultured Aquimarina sp.]|uniref:UDP-glucose--hexose-1-phosphate uridylyltransferase n=1 Tax=uncultured Aquimarina sp. TaxID=575652 RepID=UPI00261050A5|nr:UDP-glucose--hexose-1-phosphate uridylyltransferase [uncultured Aquimarina sp.]